jgi:hypothetical protein
MAQLLLIITFHSLNIAFVIALNNIISVFRKPLLTKNDMICFARTQMHQDGPGGVDNLKRRYPEEDGGANRLTRAPRRRHRVCPQTLPPRGLRHRGQIYGHPSLLRSNICAKTPRTVWKPSPHRNTILDMLPTC